MSEAPKGWKVEDQKGDAFASNVLETGVDGNPVASSENDPTKRHNPDVEMPRPKYKPQQDWKKRQELYKKYGSGKAVPMPKPADFPTASAFREELHVWRIFNQPKSTLTQMPIDDHMAIFGYSRKPTKLEKLQNWWWIKRRRRLRRNGYSAMTAEDKRKHGELGGKLFNLRNKIAGMKSVESYRPVGTRDPVGYVPDNPKVKSVK